MPKRFLNVKEVARLLGVTPLTVRNWDQKGKLAAYRNPMNNYRMYKIEDVEKLMKKIDESQSQKPEEQAPQSQIKKLKIDIY